jgi:hypothetical protein
VATVQKFGANNRFSENTADIIPDVLRRFFPDILTVTNLPAADSVAQKVGFDTSVVLNSGRHFFIDFKIRTKDFGDILFEYRFDEADGSRAVGYCEKIHLQNCFLLSYFQDTGRAELLEMGTYRMLWKKHKSEWLERARRGERGFITTSSDSFGRGGVVYTRQLLAIPRSEYFSKMMELGEKR